MTLAVFMKDLGLQTKDMEEDLNYSQTEINIKVIIRMEKLMVKEFIRDCVIITGLLWIYTFSNGRQSFLVGFMLLIDFGSHLAELN